MPISQKYFDMCRWWTEWNKLARRVPTLTSAQMIEQFDSVMLKYATYYAKKLLEFDVAGKNFIWRRDITTLPRNSKVKLMFLILSKVMRVITLQLHWELLVTKALKARKVARMTPVTIVVDWVIMQKIVS